MSAEKRVSRGIQYLDEKVAEGQLPLHWREVLDLDRLDVGHFDTCVLGQLYPVVKGVGEAYLGNRYLAMQKAWDLNDHECDSLGFDGMDTEDYEELQEAWKEALTG